MHKEWKQVVGAPEYEASRCGQIRSIYTRRPLKGGVDKDGYRKLVICTGGRRIHRRFATVICETFHGPRPPGLVVRHLNGSRTDNRAENLAWSTQKENISDKARHGTAQRGEKHPLSKLTADAVREIRASGDTARALAGRFGVKRVTIYAVLSRRTWTHIR